MTLESLREFLLWCMIINVGLLIFSSLMILALRGWVYRLHARMFRLSEEKVASANYKFIAIYKILIIIFNVVPYIALRIIE
jgi:hypothetical protein